MKGPVLAEAFYPSADLRSYRDLDVLVAPGDLSTAIDALEADGARLLDVNWPLIAASMRGELAFTLWRGTVLDLHWDPLTEVGERREFDLPGTSLLHDRREVDVAGARVPTFGAQDTLSYLALHAALAGGDRLCWYMDLAVVLERDGPVSASGWRRAIAQRVDAPLVLMLTRVARVLGSPGATASLAAAPRRTSWCRLTQVADTLRPPENLPERMSLRTLARSARHDTVRSFRALTRTLKEERRSSPAAEGPNPLWNPAGTAEDRRRFLAEVSKR
jgi:hypothetical protein